MDARFGIFEFEEANTVLNQIRECGPMGRPAHFAEIGWDRTRYVGGESTVRCSKFEGDTETQQRCPFKEREIEERGSKAVHIDAPGI